MEVRDLMGGLGGSVDERFPAFVHILRKHSTSKIEIFNWISVLLQIL